MRFRQTEVLGAYLISPERRNDERGYFARIWCEEELRHQGLVTKLAQVNVGFSPQAGTLRGLHYQLKPFDEVKLVRCTRGSVYDVVVDLRPQSLTFKKWFGASLAAEDGTMVYAPIGCAHGYITLEPDTELMYFTSHSYVPAAARGVRFNDPAFQIAWPTEITLVSQADRSWPDFL